MKKKIFTLVLLSIISFSLASCSIGHIKDTNGDDDFSLCSIDDEKIINTKFSSYTQTMAITSQINKTVNYRARKFSGIYVLKEIYPSSNKLTIKSNITVESGNLRVVVIQDDRIIKDLPFGENQTTVIDNPNGEYVVKIVGESAKFKLKLQYIE